jgi:hypothetical protein
MNNVIILNDCIKEYKKNNELKTKEDETFEFFSIGQITKKSNLSFEDIEASIVDGTKDGGIDCFMMLVDETPIQSDEHVEEIELNESSNVKLLIGQVKNTSSLKESVIDKIYISISQIFDLEIEESDLEESFNNILVEKVLVFRKLWRKSIIKNSSIAIEYFYSCKAETKNMTETFVKKTELIINSTKDKIQNCTSKYSTYSAKELLEIYSKRPELELELILKELPVSITYDDGRIGYIGVVPIKNYFEFITDNDGVIRESIFEENIRHFQGEVDINKKIRETLEDDLENDFWWLNNGITVIASQVGQLGKTLHLKDVQIVNGLQTSFTIGKFYKEIENEQRSILIKIIVSSDKATIDKIISATNRQTPVNPALLRATDDIQRKIEMYFEQKGYYYDRRKNFYKNLGKPISKIFSIQITAQSIHAIMNFKPSEARARPTTLIKQQESYEKIFATNLNYQIFLNCCIINRLVSDYIKIILENKEEKSIARTFIHHVGRVIPSYFCQKSHLSAKEIEEIDISEINDDLISNSFDFLKECIEGFKAISTTQNINSISKSGPFEEYISNQLVNNF